MKSAEGEERLSTRPNGHARTLSASTALSQETSSRIRTPLGSRKSSREGNAENAELHLSFDRDDGDHHAADLPRRSLDGGFNGHAQGSKGSRRTGTSPLQRSHSEESLRGLSMMDEVRLSLAEEEEAARQKYGFAPEGAVHIPLEGSARKPRENRNSTAEKAGIILGIHNIFIVVSTKDISRGRHALIVNRHDRYLNFSSLGYRQSSFTSSNHLGTVCLKSITLGMSFPSMAMSR